jgi:hypothetical protein
VPLPWSGLNIGLDCLFLIWLITKTLLFLVGAVTAWVQSLTKVTYVNSRAYARLSVVNHVFFLYIYLFNHLNILKCRQLTLPYQGEFDYCRQDWIGLKHQALLKMSVRLCKAWGRRQSTISLTCPPGYYMFIDLRLFSLPPQSTAWLML